MTKFRKSESMISAMATCKEFGCSVIGWSEADFLVEIADLKKLEELRGRLSPLGFEYFHQSEYEQNGVYEFSMPSDKKEIQVRPFQNQTAIVAPLGVQVGPLFIAGFFLVICCWAMFRSDPNLNHSRWLIAGTFLMVVSSVYSAFVASLWKVVFSKESLRLKSLYSNKIINWKSIAGVSVASAAFGRSLVIVVIRLHDGSGITTRSFQSSFAHELNSEIKRRLKLYRP